MRVELVRPSELTADDLGRWRKFQKTCQGLDSPYFCPEFTQAVGEVRNDAWVAKIEDGGEIAAYFPHQRSRWGHGAPIGGVLSDFHGVVAHPESMFDAVALLRGCKLVSWSFHHLLSAQRTFAAFHEKTDESHYMDLSHGYEDYLDRLRASTGSKLRELGVKRRRLERDFSDVSFEPQAADESLLIQLMDWKSKQYQASGLRDNFAYSWTRELLQRVFAMRSEHFAGMLSVLRVDGRAVAIHMGMRSSNVWNWWFPRHDPEFSRYSPGMLLRTFAAECAPGLGIERIDLGIGDSSTYKPRLRSGGIGVAIGRVAPPSLRMGLVHAREGLERIARQTPLRRILKYPGRILKRVEQWQRMR